MPGRAEAVFLLAPTPFASPTETAQALADLAETGATLATAGVFRAERGREKFDVPGLLPLF
jgi:hypothetical protein